VACGYSEQQALEEVERSGVAVEQELAELFESMGMSPEAARIAARGRGGRQTGHPFDQMRGMFESMGMSPEAARIAAIGRDSTETGARRRFAEATRPLRESAATLTRQVTLTESARLTEAAGGKPTSARFRARLIAGDIQGSSGFYPAKTLRESAGAFHAGLPVYLDHPSISEAYERPERSVRDLAGKLATEARYEGDGLYATIEVFPHMTALVESLAEFIGLSIRASGETAPSVSESIRGPIVTAITAAESVDLVTRAGAGGRLDGRAA